MALIKLEIPRAKRGGNKRTINVREVVNRLMYVLSTGSQWRAVPKDLPPLARSTTTSAAGSTTARWPGCIMPFTSAAASMRAARRVRPRRSSTAKASRAPKKGYRIDQPGFDGGKKIKGKKRHVLVDTQGLLMEALVHAADIQDRDGGVMLMASLFGLYPLLLKLYADGGYQGPKFQQGFPPCQ
jgi:transposase